ncbi:MAG: hypothetical protein HYZ68_03065, partial [Chloroflexi bacterium]|nr:hypothetical protein [Chloroflexota bacterium]
RSKIYLQYRFAQDDPLHTGPERIFGEKLRRAGFEIWFNPRMVALHEYQPSLREWIQMGIVRGYYFIAVRRRYSYLKDRVFRTLGWLAPLTIAPLLWVKDVFRLLRHAPRLGLAKWEYLKLPAYALAYLWLDLAVMVGMYQSLAGHPLPRLPFANPSPPPASPR